MILLPRSRWGANQRFPRRGHPIGPLRRTEVFIHHTAIVDRDSTPNEWQTVHDVKARMRQLQTSRPDLGMDVPYNLVAFCMDDGRLLVCEGRGLHRTGAHTKGHNRSALGVAFQGNFDSRPLPRKLDSQLAELGRWLHTLRYEQGFENLGDSRPAGRHVWGHREARSAKTVCPGRKLFARLGQIRFIDGESDDVMDKATWKLVQRALQAQEPPLYGGKRIDGKPGKNTHTAVRAFEKRMALIDRGVIGTLGDPDAAIWPATRELLFVSNGAGLGFT